MSRQTEPLCSRVQRQLEELSGSREELLASEETREHLEECARCRATLAPWLDLDRRLRVEIADVPQASDFLLRFRGLREASVPSRSTTLARRAEQASQLWWRRWTLRLLPAGALAAVAAAWTVGVAPAARETEPPGLAAQGGVEIEAGSAMANGFEEVTAVASLDDELEGLRAVLWEPALALGQRSGSD